MSQKDKGQQLECEAIVDSSLGQELEKDECQVLTSVMKARTLSDGEVLVKEGEDDNRLFILTKGKLIVSSEIDGKNVPVYTMKVGECAGTRAFVDLAPRRATLTAEGDTMVYTLDPADFERLLESHPRIVYKVMRGLFRLTHMNLMRMNVETQELSNYIHSRAGGISLLKSLLTGVYVLRLFGLLEWAGRRCPAGWAGTG